MVRDEGRYVDRSWVEAARAARKTPTEAEARVWEILRNRRCHGLKFRREQVIDGFRADFYCPSVGMVIEVDGGVHDDPRQSEYDVFRTRHFEAMGLRVHRVRNEEVSIETLDRVLSPYASPSSSGPPSPSWERGLGGEVSTLFISAESADSLDHPACAPLLAAWSEHSAAIGEGDDLRLYLRKSFFDFHKKLYENRPIYFPLSSSKKSFVAFISIHRWQDDTLNVLLADHLVPARRRLEGELDELRTARASGGNKGKAERRFTEAQKLLEELTDFIAKVTELAERGAPPTDDKTPRREVDARFVMDLDDGVMVNSAALWPLLDPQWKDPKKWWKELATAQGKKDYDWSHLAARYFPTRVRAKCETDPSLGVAHGCFWALHPAKAYAWELRLQDEIRAEFTIDEEGSDAARGRFLREHPAAAREIEEKERKRREKKAAKAGDAEDGAGPLFEGAEEETEEAEGA